MLGSVQAQKVPQKPTEQPVAAQGSSGATTAEARFLAALQEMMGGAEMTDDAVREAIGKLTPEQKQQLMQEAGGQELKREMLTNEDSKADRSLYFKEVNRSAEAAGLPVDQDNNHLAKKVVQQITERSATRALSGGSPLLRWTALELLNCPHCLPSRRHQPPVVMRPPAAAGSCLRRTGSAMLQHHTCPCACLFGWLAACALALIPEEP